MTARGKIVLTILILGVVGFGAWKWWDHLVPRRGAMPPTATTSSGTNAVANAKDAPAPELADFMAEVPTLTPPASYQVKSNTVVVELSEYAGYAGFIAANGGLEPNTNSIFFKKHSFLVHLTMSEEESWPALNSGKMAASATTADVLAIYGKQFQVIVPAQIGYSRGADGVVVRTKVKRINDLKGKILTSEQFTEARVGFHNDISRPAQCSLTLQPTISLIPPSGTFYPRVFQSIRRLLNRPRCFWLE